MCTGSAEEEITASDDLAWWSSMMAHLFSLAWWYAYGMLAHLMLGK